jgi:phospholipid N-methyltransferase
MAKTLASYWHFLMAALDNQIQTGTIIPSQRFLISKMLAPIRPDHADTIIELGAGTGALTLHLAEKCPAARIVACEINPALARHLETRVKRAGLQHRVTVAAEPAEQLLPALCARSARKPQFVLSGIPLGNLGREHVLELVRLISQSLRPGGMYIQFQYSLLDRKKIRSHFARLRTVPAFLNFPPAVVYYAQK